MQTQGPGLRDRYLDLPTLIAVFAGAGLVFVAIVWFAGDAVSTIERSQIRKIDDVAFRATLVDRSRFPPSGQNFRLYEDDLLMGPVVDEPWMVRRQGRGSYCRRFLNLGPGRPTGVEIFLSASDDSNILRNGRTYSIRFPRRTIPAARFVLFSIVVFAIVVPLKLRSWSASLSGRLPSGRSFSLRQSLVALGFVIFSLYVFQAPTELIPRAAPLLIVVCVLGASSAALSPTRRLSLGTWAWWMGGLVVWGVATVLLNSGSYSSASVLPSVLLSCLGGALVVNGSRGAFVERGEPRPFVAVFLALGFAGAVLLRSAYLDIGSWIGHFQSAGLYRRDIWVFKLGEHWMLVLAWVAVIAIAGNPKMHRWWLVLIGIGTIAVIGFGTTSTSVVALLLSVFVASLALWRPVLVRRVVGWGSAGCVLCAPFIARFPWWLRSHFDDHPYSALLDTAEVGLRGGVWRYASDVIAFHPFVGWGLGVSKLLPGKDVPLRKVLHVPDGGFSTVIGETLALPGGHPHSISLQTWMDLGLVGAILLAGLVLAVTQAISERENSRGVHAGLIGLMTVTIVYFSVNYDAWNPTLMSLIWMPAALAVSVLPVAGAQPSRSGAGLWFRVMLIVGLGCAGIFWVRADRWQFVRSMRQPHAVLTDNRTGLLVGGKELKLKIDPHIKASIESVVVERERTLVRGWALDTGSRRAQNVVLVFVGDELPGVVWPDRPSKEVLNKHPNAGVGGTLAGFQIQVRPDMVENGEATMIVLMNHRGAFKLSGSSLASLTRSVAFD